MSLKINSLKEISQKYSTFFFDLDGVIWKGPQKIKGGVESLNCLRQQDKRLFFITNSSIRNKAMLKDRFKQFGFSAELDEIFPTDFITSLYLKKHHPSSKKILVFGEQSLADQIRKTGKAVWHYTDGTLISDIPELIKIVDKDVDTVVFGYDRNMNYTKMCLASFHVQNGAKFIGTNPDKYTMVGGYRMPGCGSLLSCVEQTSGVTAEIAGKPNSFILNYLTEECKIKKEECLMIGDNLLTDIAFGNNCGIDTLCVLTGNSTEQMVLQAQSPTYYCQQLL